MEAIRRRRLAVIAWLRRTTGEPPRLSGWAWAADVILAVLLTIGAVNGVAEQTHEPLPVDLFPPDPQMPPVPFGPLDPPVESHDWRLFLVAAASALPLATRRRFPLASFWIIAVAAMRVYQNGGDPTWTVVASVVAAYSAPMFSRYRNLALVSVVVAGVLVITGNSTTLPSLPSGVVTFVLLSSVGLAANAIHVWRQRAHEAARVATDLERARLARELHDVVSHNVSVMVVQAGAARKVLDTDPSLAKEALLAVEAGGRAAMTELRQVIGLLTVDDDGLDLAPQPDLAGLPALVDRVRSTGVPVTLDLAPVPDLPPGVALAAYRVVQEALTNTMRHAAGSSATVSVTAAAGGVLRIEVTDTGGTPAGTRGSGRGLAGLRERLAVYGGTLTAGPRPTGGFRVLAEIPLEAP
ncbi:sensor histidine kinase [Dactylosporangium sucinum]|uniref:histidine kinase n=1 Tax=Dactylosporangium sucinum TaxID=1424081 RepID=A0A917X6F3_9ACTN|nr:sensor histidine kinase [Dactylosporangium sucinum]GGM79564.1 two-component sensor histidine kinase [Dactylosporangium sucinum]